MFSHSLEGSKLNIDASSKPMAGPSRWVRFSMAKKFFGIKTQENEVICSMMNDFQSKPAVVVANLRKLDFDKTYALLKTVQPSWRKFVAQSISSES